MLRYRSDIRNIAIIAHVDHGKTTLVDAVLKQTGTFRENQKVDERIMDSNPQERERGITIFAKNASFFYKDTKVNIVDTPGHADFGGEVERILKMVNGAVLLVDALEGPMPQTKFVLRKALELHLKILVVINKIDRPNCNPMKVLDEVLDLFIHLGAHEDQLDFPYVFASAKSGFAINELGDEPKDITPLLDMILAHMPPPEADVDAPFQMLVNTIDYSEYLGKIAIGRIFKGSIKKGDPFTCLSAKGKLLNGRVAKLFIFEKLGKVEISEASAGDIIALTGLEDISIGDTLTHPEHQEVLPSIEITEPTISMFFSVNNSPFAGKEGKFVTSRNIRDRLYKELLSNVALRVEDTESADTFKVSGRGELHLSVLIETLRREGYELGVSRPEVIIRRDEEGRACEPIESVTIDVPDTFVGIVIEKMGKRKAEMKNMTQMEGGLVRLDFEIPTRGLLGFNTEFITDTKGEGILTHIFKCYEPFRGEINSRQNGVLVSAENGDSVAYAISSLDDRGVFFVEPGTAVYEGMIVGESNREFDMNVNVCKTKKLTNMRASGSDEALRLTPPRKLTLEQALEFIEDDELVEVTPKSIRLRKKTLDSNVRAKETKKKKAATEVA
ncbi:GTP-binding protein TypA [Chloroherpeton thalassium ATCC 35110]|uniref:Large ribosomal subunit assembly factor BipA n=1 Tax=Chloroherpeton thalassium (strain ATCC 35110 / GB-78) TaxID=517418 RepID=B3QTD9_CHLT3|nr:translational GTPase TypA [Chloroherpeton thalassium]ACF12685.1 GTP-binding protein TypA [Chloroherpeton thalassium ATCC 35110]